ncbi:hypothetical protein CTH_2243 [Carboxydocella thermautotrophica]|nr:hypothetical protein CTH_2243 [Carboxydocella thermautotrophica]
MGRVIQVGEEREIGIELFSTDGTNFMVTATYEYKDPAGNILASGPAQVDGHKVFVLLKPTVSNRNPVVFTCTITPLDQQGQPDPNKNQEKLIVPVPVIVP